MKTFRLGFLGYGNVGRALARLLRGKATELRERYDIACQVTGVATRRRGWLANPEGLDLEALESREPCAGRTPFAEDMPGWLHASQVDVVFEMTSLNIDSGQPAVDHVRMALDHGCHAITANKGPVVFAYRELLGLARARRRRFLFESAVMDGAPIFSLFRETLPASRLLRFRGLLNSTTNFILTEMEAGRSFEDSLRCAQEIGIAETDPDGDIDGWDAAIKVCALATVLMDTPLKPQEVARQGIRGLSAEAIRAAKAQGTPYKLVCQAERQGRGVVASVKPGQVPLGDPLASVSGTSSIVHFELDVLPGLTVVEHDPGPETTAYGLLADFVRAVRPGLDRGEESIDGLPA